MEDAPDLERTLSGIHHRIKNHLQFIDSLISLQARSAAHDSVRAALDLLQGRVRAITALYETLYSSSDLANILFGSYLAELVRNVDASPAVSIQAADMVLSTEQALPLGLILNELLTECLNHAPARGSVTLSLRYVDPSAAELALDLPSPDVQAMNLYLVHLLLPQVNGSLDVSPEHEGQTKFTIRFPLALDL